MTSMVEKLASLDPLAKAAGGVAWELLPMVQPVRTPFTSCSGRRCGLTTARSCWAACTTEMARWSTCLRSRFILFWWRTIQGRGEENLPGDNVLRAAATSQVGWARPGPS
ncbi:uncharacterized protein LOC119348964 [Triticum dicoccoides]|uniref:uncharacterized protein LOC119348964 n=1 Tax=Triticum dicoccoides TaxID=85692 RepID=UPI00188F74A0|nr:uncharacterized protein LOC119348964 [Triticum dicoccoides]